MEAQGRHVHVRFLEPSSIMPAGDEIGAKLQTSPQTPVLRRYRMHLADRVPYRILDSYYLASLLGDLVGKDEGYIPLFKWLREHTGGRASRAFEQLQCRMPTSQQTIFLTLPHRHPLLALNR